MINTPYIKLYDVVSLAHNVSFWAHKVNNYIGFWLQNICSNGLFLFPFDSYIIQNMF